MATSGKPVFCPKCGYKGIHPSGGSCSKCGARLSKGGPPAEFTVKKGVVIPLLILMLIIGGVTYLYFTNEEVATELQQIRQPRPNQFFVGIDVSATISTDTLEKLKDATIDRLKQFIGDASVSYRITTFGNPGCGSESFSNIVSTQSPSQEFEFNGLVEEKIREVSITKVAPRDSTPLTTPLHHFLSTVLPERKGGRIIIFSDLMNDDSDCRQQFIFPDETITEFGKDRNGQIIFLYPTPYLTGDSRVDQRILERQQEFIDRMTELSRKGKIRVFFYHIPDDPLERLDFIKTQLQNAIPTTMFDLVWERTSKVLTTIVSAVRG